MRACTADSCGRDCGSRSELRTRRGKRVVRQAVSQGRPCRRRRRVALQALSASRCAGVSTKSTPRAYTFVICRQLQVTAALEPRTTLYIGLPRSSLLFGHPLPAGFRFFSAIGLVSPLDRGTACRSKRHACVNKVDELLEQLPRHGAMVRVFSPGTRTAMDVVAPTRAGLRKSRSASGRTNVSIGVRRMCRSIPWHCLDPDVFLRRQAKRTGLRSRADVFHVRAALAAGVRMRVGSA
jgi:hypothetical protein